MRRLLVVEVDTERKETWSCGKCVYASGNFCELFMKESQSDEDRVMERVNDCFMSERRYLDAAARHFDLERYEHPQNNKFKKGLE